MIAWGNSLSTHKGTTNAKVDMLSMLEEKGLDKNVKSISVQGISMKSVGTHPLYLGLHYPREKWSLIEYPLKESLEGLLQSVKQNKTENEKKATDTAKKKGKEKQNGQKILDNHTEK